MLRRTISQKTNDDAPAPAPSEARSRSYDTRPHHVMLPNPRSIALAVFAFSWLATQRHYASLAHELREAGGSAGVVDDEEGRILSDGGDDGDDIEHGTIEVGSDEATSNENDALTESGAYESGAAVVEEDVMAEITSGDDDVISEDEMEEENDEDDRDAEYDPKGLQAWSSGEIRHILLILVLCVLHVVLYHVLSFQPPILISLLITWVRRNNAQKKHYCAR